MRGCGKAAIEVESQVTIPQEDMRKFVKPREMDVAKFRSILAALPLARV